MYLALLGAGIVAAQGLHDHATATLRSVQYQVLLAGSLLLPVPHPHGVLVGDAVTLEPDVALSPPPADELHVYVFAPLAVSVALADVQTELLLAVKVNVGNGFTFMVNV